MKQAHRQLEQLHLLCLKTDAERDRLSRDAQRIHAKKQTVTQCLDELSASLQGIDDLLMDALSSGRPMEAVWMTELQLCGSRVQADISDTSAELQRIEKTLSSVRTDLLRLDARSKAIEKQMRILRERLWQDRSKRQHEHVMDSAMALLNQDDT